MGTLVKMCGRLGHKLCLRCAPVSRQARRAASGLGSAPRPPPPSAGRPSVEECVDLWEGVFGERGVSEPRLSSEYIVAHVLGANTLASLARRGLAAVLTEAQTQRVWDLCARRLERMPVQYVIEEWDFRDLTLKMRPPVFIPRPETEELVGLVLTDLQHSRGPDQRGAVLASGPSLRFLEVGCGSGAISLSLLKSLPQARAVAVDRSPAAVSLAEENAHRLGLQDRLDLMELDVMTDAQAVLSHCGLFDFIVSNPPYVFSADMAALEPEILRFEDPGALDGGADGMDVIRHILSLAQQILPVGGKVYLEVEPRQPEMLQQRPGAGLQYTATHRDFSHRPRFCVLQRGRGSGDG
ncbi:MTRF1L release factor glutamine methyltransferase [Lepisosteus oculatus]